MNKTDIKNTRVSLGLSQTEFGKMLGVGLRTVQSWEDGSRNMKESTEMLLKKELSTHKYAQSDEVTSAVYEPNAILVSYNEMSVMMVPLVTQYAYTGYQSGFSDPEYLHNLPTLPWADDKEHRGEYICIEAKGDSMDNGDAREAILEGDIMLCRVVRQDYWKSKLHINQWDFVIVTKNDGIVAKRIIKHDVENGIITLRSLNDYYPDRDIHLRDVDQILNIVDIKRKRRR